MGELPTRPVPAENEGYRSEKQLVDYETHRRNFIEWLLVFGKDPDSVEGYAEDTVYETAYRCGKFDRFAWEREDAYVLSTHDHADACLEHLAMEDDSGSHKANTKDALLRYFKWRHHEFGEEPCEPASTSRRTPTSSHRTFRASMSGSDSDRRPWSTAPFLPTPD